MRPRANDPSPSRDQGFLAASRFLGFTRHELYRGGGLELLEGSAPEAILEGARVGIDFAREEDRLRPWRFAIGGTAWVSQRAGLVESCVQEI